MLVDTHAHLCDPVFDRDRGPVLETAAQAGVGAVIAVGEDLDDARRNLELAHRHKSIRPAAGLYPTMLDLGMASALVDFIQQNRSRLVAIGEVGLDYRFAESAADRATQRAVFSRSIEAGRLLDLPLSVHVRSAGHYVLDLLGQQGCRRAVLHAFDGKAKYARQGAEQSFYFSVPGTVLISQQKRKLVRALPLDRILLESDTPALSPDPHRPSEPAILARI
ncbi:MAG: TatD family hydrolase, partial [Anaerolineae bacterium]